MSRRCPTVAVSGPDGAGKSTLVRVLAARLTAQGITVATAYGYGCFACRSRRCPAPPAAAAAPRRRTWLARVHPVMDAAELAGRLTLARVRARLRARWRPAIVLTDRGPLDGLVKFGPPPCSPAAAMFGRISRWYDLTLLLDAPAEVLTGRDREHPGASLAAMRREFHAWSRRLPAVRTLAAGSEPPAALADEALRAISRLPGTGMSPDRPVRPRVVISSYDSSGNPQYGGGGAVVIERVAQWLAPDYRVTVVTAGRRSAAVTRAGVRYRYLPVAWAGPRAGQLLFHALLPLAARRIPHDLWIENFTPPFSTSFVPLFSSAPVAGLAQTLSGEEMTREYRLPFFLIERAGLRCYRDIVVLNAADGERVHRFSPASRVTVIPNCTDTAPLAPSRAGSGEHILYLGRIQVWEKGLDLLLAAYQRSGLAMPLIIAGGGTRAQERRLRWLLGRTGAGVRWVGWVDRDRKRDLLERSAVLVLPSRQEAFGLVALEAMASGKPVIHFDLPTLRWMDGDVRVPALDVSALTAALRDLAGDEPARRRLGQAGQAAAGRFTPEHTADRYRTLVRRLVGTPAASAHSQDGAA